MLGFFAAPPEPGDIPDGAGADVAAGAGGGGGGGGGTFLLHATQPIDTNSTAVHSHLEEFSFI